MPLYRALAERVSIALKSGTLEDGLVLLEGPLSDIFGTSRATVRNALSMLAEEGTIGRFDGRGFIVQAGQSPTRPIRRRLSTSDFPVNGSVATDTLPASDQIIAEVEQALSIAIAFGHFRVNEQRLADLYGVSRPVAREVLWRLRELGLVEKDLHSPWLAGPLTARAVSEDRELRTMLEPHALMISAPRLTHGEVSAMLERVAAARGDSGHIRPAVIDRLEVDLHEDCIRHLPNGRILQILRKGRTPLHINALFARFVGLEPDAPEFGEHEAILREIAAGNWNEASQKHARHLFAEGKRTLDRLKVLSVVQEPPLPAYLERIT